MALTWTQQTTPTANNNTWRSICWSPDLGLFCAVGAVNAAGTDSHRIMTSPDGAVWTIQDSGVAAANTWSSVCWAGGGIQKFIAVKQSGTNRAAYSSDGINWTSVSVDANIWNYVCWHSGLDRIVAVASSGTNRTMYSDNGTSWTPVAAAAANSWGVVTAAGSIGFIAGSLNGGSPGGVDALMTSVNGTSWTGQNTPGGAAPTTGTNIADLGYSSSLGLAIAVLANRSGTNVPIITSPDGVNWTGEDTPNHFNVWNGIAIAPGLVVVVDSDATDTNQVLESTDTLSWTANDPGLSPREPWVRACFSPDLGLFAAIANNTNNNGKSVMTAPFSSTGVSPSSGTVAGNTAITVTGDGTNGGFNSTPGSYFNTYWVLFGDLTGLGLDFNTHVNPSTALTVADTYQPDVTVVSTTELTAVTPVGPDDTVDVAVILNTTNPLVKNLLFYQPGGYTYNPPTLSGIAPSSGSPLGGTPVVLSGTNFFFPNNGAVTDASGTHVDNVVVFDSAEGVFGNFISDVEIDAITPANPGPNSVVDVTLYPGTLSTGVLAASKASFSYSPSTLTLAYTYTTSWWSVDVGPFTFFFFAPFLPDPLTFNFGFFWEEIWYPPFYEFVWDISSPPDDKGWWISIDDKFNGAAMIVTGGVPRNPRSFDEIATFATGSSSMQGGFPGVATMWNNHLVYAKGGYTVGTDRPPIHIFDGSFDHQIALLPPTTAGTIPKALMTSYTADGKIYVTTFDSGTGSSDWSGRVFSLDVETTEFTQIGDTFPAGHIPYALTSYMGKLWCGTNRQDPTASGKLYSIRPGVDTAWVLERDLTTDSVGSCTSLLGFQGKLYIGTSAQAGTFAKIIVRDTAGVYTTSLTATGGTAKDNNAFLALVEFNDLLFASYWNNDTTPVSKIYKFDGTTWSTPFTAGSTASRVPYVGFPTDLDTLLAIGGGIGYAAALQSTTDGTTWNDHTVFLTQSTPTSTGLPAFGVVVK